MARKWQVRRKFLHQQTGLRDLSFLVPTDPRELAEFVRVARGEAPSPCTGEDALQALRIAIAATRSRVLPCNAASCPERIFNLGINSF